MGALDGGCIVQRCLSQRLAVFLLADLALAQCQVELSLLFGQRARGLSGRVVLAVEASEGVLSLGETSIVFPRDLWLRLVGVLAFDRSNTLGDILLASSCFQPKLSSLGDLGALPRLLVEVLKL
ncbi:hypothetical protein D3C77_311530 [compost metagenome]